MPSSRRPGLASIHIYVPPEDRDGFKAATQQRGEDMTAALTRYIRDYNKRNARLAWAAGLLSPPRCGVGAFPGGPTRLQNHTERDTMTGAEADREEVFLPFPGTDAETFIQWKGTTVCMDFHCGCGNHGHLDTGFAYFVECPECGAVYEMGTQVLARKIDPAEAYNPVVLR